MSKATYDPSCPRCNPPASPALKCDYPGCGYTYLDDLDRIAHRAVYDDKAHARRVEASHGKG